MTDLDALHYERSARTSLHYWTMLGIGLVFVWAGSTIDPLTNCSADGECAPWLVPVAKWVGIAIALAGAGHLWVNPRWGSRIDPQSGELVWWQNRLASWEGDGGRIHPSQLGKVRILSDSDSDAVFLYNLDGERQPFFDTDVIPWPYEKWADSLTAKWPHIQVEKD